MNATRLVGLRGGTKSRLLLYLGALLFLGLVIYVYHGCQIQLEDLRQKSDKSQQQQESLSAQLQVIFEYKLRLEKSLQQEKNEHRQTKDELQSKALAEKTLKDKTILEAMNKYTSLQQQHKLLRSQHDDLDEECNKVRISQLQGLEERSRLESQVQAVQQELDQIQAAREKELEDLKSHYLQLEVELERMSKLYKEQSSKVQHSTNTMNHLQKQNHQLVRELSESKDQLKSCQRGSPAGDIPARVVPQASAASKTSSTKTTAAGVHDPKPRPNFVVDLPDKEAVDKVGGKSTTPLINPDAVNSLNRASASANANVVPMPPPQREEEAAPMPAGVVPAPHGYGDTHLKHMDKDPLAPNNNNNNNNNGWEWNYKKPQQHQPDLNNQHDNLLRFQYLNNLHNVDQQQQQHHRQAEVNRDSNINNGDVDRRHDADDRNDVNIDFHHNAIVHHNAADHHVAVDRPNVYDHNALDRPNVYDHNGANFDVHRNAMGADVRNVRRDAAGELHPQRGHLLDAGGRLPRPAHNMYPRGDYERERDGQRNDLHMEEGEEEGDDDVDQLDYVNENLKHNNVLDPKQQGGAVNVDEQRDGVMVNPK